MPEHVTMSSPVEFLDTMPYLLGFVPEESLVLTAFRHGRVQVTARMDLQDEVLLAAGRTVHQLVKGAPQIDSIVVVVVTEDPDRWRDTAESVGGTVLLSGLRVDDVLITTTERFWSMNCDDARCCPPEGRLREQATPASTSLVYAGLVAARSRADLISLVRQDVLVTLDDVEHARRMPSARVVSILKMFDTEQPGHQTHRPNPATAAALALNLRRAGIRDAAWLYVDQGRGTEHDCRSVLAASARMVPIDQAVPLWFLWAWQMWRRGDGASARAGVEQALLGNAEYEPARMLEQALDSGMSPFEMAELGGVGAAHE